MKVLQLKEFDSLRLYSLKDSVCSGGNHEPEVLGNKDDESSLQVRFFRQGNFL